MTAQCGLIWLFIEEFPAIGGDGTAIFNSPIFGGFIY
jgi:hypothetical protein